MKEKIKIICLILIAISIVVSTVVYTFRTLIDIGCSSPNLYSMKETGTAIEKIGSVEFFGVRCLFWNKLFQLQQNY